MSRLTERKSTVRFGAEAIAAEFKGSKPRNYNPVKLLLEFPDPFGISYAPKLQLPSREYDLVRFDGPGHFVGINTGDANQSNWAVQLDREKGRALYNPTDIFDGWDDYIAFARNHFGTQYKMPELLLGLEEKGIPFYQISPNTTVVRRALGDGNVDQDKIWSITGETEQIYTARGEVKGPGFVIDGPIKVTEILAGVRVIPKNVDFTLSEEEIRQELMQDW